MMPRKIFVSIGTSSSSGARRQRKSPAKRRRATKLSAAVKVVVGRVCHAELTSTTRIWTNARFGLDYCLGSGRFFGALPDQGLIQQAYNPGNDSYIG